MTTATSTMDEAEGKVTALESKLKEVQQQSSETDAAAAEQVAAVQAELDAAKKAKDTASSGLEALWNTVNKKETEIAETKSKLLGLESTVVELNAASAQMAAALTTLVGVEPPSAVASMKPEDSILTAKEQEGIALKVRRACHSPVCRIRVNEAMFRVAVL